MHGKILYQKSLLPARALAFPEPVNHVGKLLSHTTNTGSTLYEFRGTYSVSIFRRGVSRVCRLLCPLLHSALVFGGRLARHPHPTGYGRANACTNRERECTTPSTQCSVKRKERKLAFSVWVWLTVRHTFRAVDGCTSTTHSSKLVLPIGLAAITF